MKTTRILSLLAAMCSLLPASLSANSFVSEGKVWDCLFYENHSFMMSPLCYKPLSSTYWLEGDTLIAGRSCMKMYYTSPYGITSFVAPYFEEERKVFFFPSPQAQEPLPAYDFTAQAGDSLILYTPECPWSNPCVENSTAFRYSFYITHVSDTLIGGAIHRCWQVVADEEEYVTGLIIDGVGTPNGPLGVRLWGLDGSCTHLLTCHTAGEIDYFDNPEFRVEEYLAKPLGCWFVNEKMMYEGVPVWLTVAWNNIPLPGADTVQQLDSICNGNIYVSYHFRSSVAATTAYAFFDDVSTSLGPLPAGDYNLILSVVDDDDSVVLVPYEKPFTVFPRPDANLRGMVCTSGPDEQMKDHWNHNPYTPDISVRYDETGDTLLVSGWLVFTCCLDHFCYYEMAGDTLFIRAIDNEGRYPCDCYLPHSVEFRIAPVKHLEKLTLITDEPFMGTHTTVFNLTCLPPVRSEPFTTPAVDLQGRPLPIPTDGIYIRDGRKEMVK